MTTEELFNDEIPTQIIPLILWRLRDSLQVRLVDEVPESNPTRAVSVKVGQFKNNPLNINVNISISGGDFEDPRFMDGRIDNPGLDDFLLRNLPAGEVGGGEFWWRCGTINFQTFFVRQRYPEEVAMQYAYDLYGRLLNAVKETDLSGLIDDYAEGAFNPVYVEGASFFESGGKDKYIWRGKLRFRVLTWRP